MLAFSVLFAILVSGVAIAYVAWPLLESGPAPVIVENDRLTDLIGRKDATLTAIKDLEFDYNTGKLSEDDYERMDDRLRRQAITYIQQIEKLAPESAQMDGRIEAEIARLRKTGATPAPVFANPVPVSQQSVVAPQVTATQQVTVATAAVASPAGVRFCTNCGKPVQPTHKFCANCGAAISGE
jgi:hypothetical protein